MLEEFSSVFAPNLLQFFYEIGRFGVIFREA
jgi:hypothetical protein